MLDTIHCPKCKSLRVRSYDNQPLKHPSEKEVLDGTPKVDFEIYMMLQCDNCEHLFTQVFDLVPAIIQPK